MTTFALSNSRLAAALSVDPSLISRWRSGSRTPSRKSRYLESIAAFIVRRIEKPSQRAALMEILSLPAASPAGSAELEKILLLWLDGAEKSEDTMIDNLLNRMQTFGKQSNLPPPPGYSLDLPEADISAVSTFYGIKGKQAAVMEFLSLVLASPAPTTLLLYSDESMEWLTSDPEFYVTWGYMTFMVLSKGHRIRIVHTLQRDIAEMHEAIESWLPLYMTGSIEPYYYPRYREQIFRRTLFVAPGIASLTTVSMADSASGAAHQLNRNPRVVHALSDEFNRFLSFCRPLMRVVTGDQLVHYPALRSELEEQAGNLITAGIFPSSITLPQSLLPALMLDDTQDKDRITSLHHERFNRFTRDLSDHTYTEILYLSGENDLLERAMDSDFSLSYFTDHLRYTREALKTHLLHIVQLLEVYPNFHFWVVPHAGHGSVHLTVKEDVGVLLHKTDHPHIAFAFNQPQLTHSFHNYLESVTEQIVSENRNRQSAICRLRDIAARL
jgi:hypothetical protein